MRTVITIAVLVALLGVSGYAYIRYVHAETATSYRTAKVEQGEMLPTINATGTIEPEEVVDIGSQVTGPITELKVDWGTPVAAGNVWPKSTRPSTLPSAIRRRPQSSRPRPTWTWRKPTSRTPTPNCGAMMRC